MEWSSWGEDFYSGLATEHEVKRTMIVEALREAHMTPACAGWGLLRAGFCGRVAGGYGRRRRHGRCWRRRGVASVAGSAFFRPGKGEDLLRFCFAKKDKDLVEALPAGCGSCDRARLVRGSTKIVVYAAIL